MSGKQAAFAPYEWPGDVWCVDCGVNPSTVTGRCSSCQADEDFLNCPFCEGAECTRECEDDYDYGPARSGASS